MKTIRETIREALQREIGEIPDCGECDRIAGLAYDAAVIVMTREIAGLIRTDIAEMQQEAIDAAP